MSGGRPQHHTDKGCGGSLPRSCWQEGHSVRSQCCANVCAWHVVRSCSSRLLKPGGRTLSSMLCRCFDTETSATISLPTFLLSLAQLKALSVCPQSSSSCVSFAKYNDNKLRHHRVEYDPQSSLSSPVTTQQVTLTSHTIITSTC